MDSGEAGLQNAFGVRGTPVNANWHEQPKASSAVQREESAQEHSQVQLQVTTTTMPAALREGSCPHKRLARTAK